MVPTPPPVRMVVKMVSFCRWWMGTLMVELLLHKDHRWMKRNLKVAALTNLRHFTVDYLFIYLLFIFLANVKMLLLEHIVECQCLCVCNICQ